jgi:hypothetical protein
MSYINRGIQNLNNLLIASDCYSARNGYGKELEDYSVVHGKTNVYFRNIKDHLIRYIKESDMIVGCVAWLTCPEILEAMAGKQVSIVVQKEDFLRPDTNAKGSEWKNKLRILYKNLGMMELTDVDVLYNLSYGGNDGVGGVRCAGNHNKDKHPAFPRMHNKFLIFCKSSEEANNTSHIGQTICPYAVWTGSFNFSINAGNSLENAVVLRDRHILLAYYKEFNQILAISEPLDWESEWCAPEWRIGS